MAIRPSVCLSVCLSVALDQNSRCNLLQISCGEEFSVALCDKGLLYSAGAAQHGQLGNGETGEHFITANKLAYANATSFNKRSTFCHAPTEKLHTNNDKNIKVVPLPDSANIRLQQVACGKHHTLALEAASEDDVPPRLFSWGCGDYGVLGHGVQQDDYFPRSVGALANLHLPTKDGSPTISAGQHCSLVTTAGSGHVYYWGKHRSVGEATMRPTLVDVLANNQHVVTHAAAGGQTVVCSTAHAQTVAWGAGSHGELGLTDKKSTAKPAFVPGLEGSQVIGLACGYGHTVFVVDGDGKKLPALAKNATAALEEGKGSTMNN